MADQRFYTSTGPLTFADIKTMSGSNSAVPGETLIHDVADLTSATPRDIVFYDNTRLQPQLQYCKAAACITKENLAGQVPSHMVTIVTDNPRRAFAEISRRLYPEQAPAFHQERIHPNAEVDQTAAVAPTAIIGAHAQIGRNVHIGHHAVIHDGAKIGDDTVIGEGAIIGRGVELGRKCRIGAHCSITHTLAGDEVAIAGGTRIGIAGYGLERTDKGFEHLPHLGTVTLGNRVEVDANSVIERGALSATGIGDGTKIGSQVMIGHNVQIGRDCLVLSQAGIAGSTVVGDRVTIGPQVGIADHATIGDDVRMAPQTGVLPNSAIPAGMEITGSPAAPLDRRGLIEARRALTPNTGQRLP